MLTEVLHVLCVSTEGPDFSAFIDFDKIVCNVYPLLYFSMHYLWNSKRFWKRVFLICTAWLCVWMAVDV